MFIDKLKYTLYPGLLKNHGKEKIIRMNVYKMINSFSA